MAQSSNEDKSRGSAPRPKRAPEARDDETVKELVEAVATAYFSACRRLAATINRLKSGRRAP